MILATGLMFGAVTKASKPAAADTPLPDITQISMGGQLNCGLDALGVAYCWGSANVPKGDGTTSDYPRPKQITSTKRFIKIAAGDWHACAIATDNSTWCWGWGGEGEMANGQNANQSTPVQAQLASGGNASFVDIGSGRGFSCGRTSANKIYCWGDDEQGAIGEDAALVNKNKAVLINGGAGTYTSLSVGYQYACAIQLDSTPTNRIVCWGANDNGVLGIGGYVQSPTAQLAQTSKQFSSVSAGADHTCAIEQGTNLLYCWGDNYHGQLGNNMSTGTINAPPATAYSATQYSQVFAGYESTCAITIGGVTQCWGDNANGATGADYPNQHNTPTTVPGVNFTSIFYAQNHSSYCGTDTTKTLRCWGTATLGMFGNTTHPFQQYPPAQPNSGIAFTQMTSTELGSCGITATGATYCWGEGAAGSLGNNRYAAAYNPQLVPGVSLSQVSTSSTFACGVGKSDGTGYCWGDNVYGETGVNSFGGMYISPQIVTPTSLKFSKIVTGHEHACGLGTDQRIYCWGHDDYGQVGNTAPNANLATATAVDDTLLFSDVTTGENFSCGITDATSPSNPNKLYCWGSQSNGHLGNNQSSGKAETPQTIDSGVSYKSVAAGGEHACAITSANVLRCWGGDAATGTGTASNVLTPATVNPNGSGTDTYSSVIGADGTTCGITTLGATYCWGWNSQSQLGTTGADALTPQLLPGGHTWTSLNGGWDANTICGVKTDGGTNVLCWGQNNLNQTDTYVNPTYSTPTAIFFASGTLSNLGQYQNNGSVQIATGGASYPTGTTFKATVNSNSSTDQLKLCVEVKPLGAAFTNTEADLQCSNTTVASGATASVKVTGLNVGTSYRWQARTLGTESGYGPTLTSYGNNAETETDFSVQTSPALGLPQYSQMALGTGISCGLDTMGIAYCWGISGVGKGNGTNSEAPTPVQITSSKRFTSIGAGSGKACALATDHTTWCWGDGFGDSPVQIQLDAGGNALFDQISVADHICGLTPAGLAYCWGSNAYGQLGIGNYTNQWSSPAKPDTLLSSFR